MRSSSRLEGKHPACPPVKLKACFDPIIKNIRMSRFAIKNITAAIKKVSHIIKNINGRIKNISES